MARRKINYKEGQCVAIPLRAGGFARGVVARMDGKGRVFGYFFGPKYLSIDDVEDCASLKSQDAVLVGRFGDPGILNHEWPVIGEIPNWDKSSWPMPALIRIDELEKRAWLSYYDEHDFSLIREEEVSPDLEGKFPYDRGMGYGAVEIRLTKLLK